jgi:hypothetical protein
LAGSSLMAVKQYRDRQQCSGGQALQGRAECSGWQAVQRLTNSTGIDISIVADSYSTGVASSKVDGKQYGDWQRLADNTGAGSRTAVGTCHISRQYRGWKQYSVVCRHFRGWKQYSGLQAV